jgi:hypothetical protein
MKKGYVRTEIIRFLNKKEKSLNHELTANDVHNFLPELYEHLKNDELCELKTCSFEEFKHHATIGFQIAMSNFAFGVQ